MLKSKKIFRISRNRGGLILPLILLMLLFSSCGVAIPAYLNPPVYLANLSFYHAYNNDPDYAIGYDFFYRIYDESIIDLNSVINEANTFFNEIKLLGLKDNYRPSFSDSYFRRILPISDDLSTVYSLKPFSSTIMPVDPSYFDKSDSTRKFNAYLNISSAALTDGEGEIRTISYSPPGSFPEEINFKRYVTESKDSSTFIVVPFNDVDPIKHDDIPELAVGAVSIDIAFFVVLYGRTPEFTPIFSDVVYIGSYTNLLF